MRVAIVGGGIVGASAARMLARRGHAVTLFERFERGHRRGSSHGRSRIVRKAYSDAFLTGLMQEAYPLWADLEAASGRRLLREVGLLHFGEFEAPGLLEAMRALEANGVAYEVLSVGRWGFPGLPMRFDPNEIAAFTREAGLVDADSAVAASLDLAHSAGADLRFGHPIQRAALEREFDAFAVAAGAWVRDWAPVEVRVTQQTWAEFPASHGGPVWIHERADYPYGFPSIDGRFKLARHHPGPSIDADTPRRDDGEERASLADYVRDRFPNALAADARTETCLYTTTPDEDFRFGRIGAKGFYASACSGHGFKFGIWSGRRLADFVEGTDQPERYPRLHGPSVD